MAGDNRDWYREWWRRKTGYVERSRFRMGHGERQQFLRNKRQAARSSAWRRNIVIALVLVAAFLAAAILR
jgi:hypothetical protein